MNQRRYYGRQRRGAVLILVVVLLVSLVGVAALSVDGGRMFLERRNTQAAADLAAEAAGIELYEKFERFQGRDSDGEARAVALAIAKANCYDIAGRESTVTVNIPPKAGPHEGQNGFAEVIVSARLSRSFSGIFGTGELEVASRAVAAGTMIPSKGSLLILEPKKKGSLKLKGKNSTLEVEGDILVNASSKDAVKVDKKAQIHAEELLVSGGVSRKSKGLIDADVYTGVLPTPDPLADLPPPPKSPTLETKDFKRSQAGKDIYDLQPGTYRDLKFSKDSVVQMKPGVYNVENGVEFRDSVSVFAPEVMIYNGGKKGFKFSTSGQVSITPPVSGTYEGISLFQNRNGKSKLEFKKMAEMSLEGIVYAPNSEVKFKNATLEAGGYEDEEEDFDADSEEDSEEDGGSSSSSSSVGASFISRRLTIGKGSLVRIRGVDINAKRPLRGLVE